MCFITLFSFSGASAFCLSCADCKHRSYVSFHTRSAACISGALGHMLMMCWLYLCLSWMFPNHIKVTVISLAFLLCNRVCLEMRGCLHSVSRCPVLATVFLGRLSGLPLGLWVLLTAHYRAHYRAAVPQSPSLAPCPTAGQQLSGFALSLFLTRTSEDVLVLSGADGGVRSKPWACRGGAVY